MLAIAVKPDQHRQLDRIWRREIPYGRSCDTRITEIKRVLELIHADDPVVMARIAQWARELAVHGLL